MTKTPKRVLFINITADLYGADRALLTLVGDLVRRRWVVRVIVPYEGPLVERLEAAGASVDVAPVGAFRRSFSLLGWLHFVAVDLPVSIWCCRRAARRADVVHVNTAPVLGGAIGARLARRPLVWHVRESFSDHWRPWLVYGRVMRLLAHVVVVNSHAIRDEAAAVGLDRKAVLVYDGADFGSGVPRAGDGNGVVTVGRINEIKGHADLVDAVALLRDRGLRVPAVIAGDVFRDQEIHRDRLEAQIARLRLTAQVRLVGFVEDVPGLLRQMSVFVLPTRRPEAFGLALVEAMAEGLACIACDAGGPKEIIDHGRTGLLVPPSDPSALADAIEQLWTDPDLRRRMGAAAAADVRARFGAEATVDGIVAVYERLGIR
jgi:glycosyltransferase involved in cell wall biosynthesis